MWVLTPHSHPYNSPHTHPSRGGGVSVGRGGGGSYFITSVAAVRLTVQTVLREADSILIKIQFLGLNVQERRSSVLIKIQFLV